MPWIRTTNCPSIATSENNAFCECDPFPGDIFTPGTLGETKTAPCHPCGGYGVQPNEGYCCNLSGTVSE